MTKAEKIWLAIGFVALAALIMLEVSRVHKAVAAAQAQFGTPDSTNPMPSGQQIGPTDGQDAIAAGVGPWWLYYNTPGAYRLLPPLVNTAIPPAMVSSPQASAVPSSCQNCA